MLTISAQTEQANSVTRGRSFHLFVKELGSAAPSRPTFRVQSVRILKEGGDARSDTAGRIPVLFPERVELEQDANMHEAEAGDADTASDGGLNKQYHGVSRAGLLKLRTF